MSFRTFLLLPLLLTASAGLLRAADTVRVTSTGMPVFLPVDVQPDEEFEQIADQQRLASGITYPNSGVEKGWNAVAERRIEDALEEFGTAGQLSPNHPMLQHGLALAYGARGCMDEAIEELRELAEARPNDLTVRFHLGLAREYGARTASTPEDLNAGLDSAIAIYSAVLDGDPTNGHVLYCQGRALFLRGHYTEANEKLVAAQSNGYAPRNQHMYGLAQRTVCMLDAAGRAGMYGFDSANSSLLYVDVPSQTMLLYRGGVLEREFVISTGKTGSAYGARLGSRQTSMGIHAVCRKIGDGAPKGTIFKSKGQTRRVAVITTSVDSLAQKLHDYVLTRVMVLKGLQPGINRGRDPNGRMVDAYVRCIYIHGTNNEAQLGTPVSHGCIRMFNDDVIWLYDHIPAGTFVIIE